MFTDRVIRWSGLPLALGGILAALFWILHPEEAVLLTNPASYQREHLLDFISLLLLIPGLIGLYAHIAEDERWVGLAGFVLALAALLVFMGVGVVDMLIWPSIAALQPDLILTADGEFITSRGPFAATVALIVPFAMIGTLGFILLGIAVWQSRRLPRWAGPLLAVGGALYTLGPGFVPHGELLLNILVYGPFAAAGVWLGLALLGIARSRTEAMPLPASPAS